MYRWAATDPDAEGRRTAPLLHHKYLVAFRAGAMNEYGPSDALEPCCVWTGSANLTWDAYNINRENVIIARDEPAFAAAYAQDWLRAVARSAPMAIVYGDARYERT